MNLLATIFLLLNAGALLLLPRRLAPLPLLVGACYMTLGQGIEVGPFSFQVIRLLVAAGVLRVLIRREWVTGGLNALDHLIIAWAVWGVFCGFFYKDAFGAVVYRMGFVYGAIGSYFLFRVFCRTRDDVLLLCRITAILLVPVALEMFYEHVASHNLFSVLGGVDAVPAVREGRTRAQGPFAHAILAGTVGATCLPMMIGLWRNHRWESMFGVVACLVMVLLSASSGPVMSAMAGLGVVALWRLRAYRRYAIWILIAGYVFLEVAMKAPAYYLLARIDLAGGSTGWHRAYLIQSAFEHLHEWWLVGTEFTRHWMPTGVYYSANQADITNHYLVMGATGGLPFMLLFIVTLWKGFACIGQTLDRVATFNKEQTFILWTLGASLFAHTVTFISVSYYDQSFVFLYVVLATAGSARTLLAVAPDKADASPVLIKSRHKGALWPKSVRVAWRGQGGGPRPRLVGLRAGGRKS